jgi:hypothetical protein
VKTLCLTFDDGCAEDAEIIRILKDNGACATFYLNSGLLGTTYFHPELGRKVRRLSAEEAKTVYAGQEVGSHTMHHPFLDRLTDEGILRETMDDRAALGTLFGKPPDTIALPFGPYPENFHRRIGALLAGSGFSAIRTGVRSMDFHCPKGVLVHPACGFPDLLASGAMEAFLASGDGAFMCVAGHGYEAEADSDGLRMLGEVLARCGKAGNVRLEGLGKALESARAE